MSAITDRIEDYTEYDDEDMAVQSWKLDRLIKDCGLSLTASTMLISAGADWHRVDEAVKAGTSEELILRIFT